MAYMDPGLKILLHPCETGYQKESMIGWLKTTLMQKDPKKELLNSLQTHNVPTYDIENTDGSNKKGIYYLLINCGMFLKDAPKE